MSSRIGVDIGGTFTDLVFFDDATGEVVVEKVPTTPDSPEEGCVNAVRNAVSSELLARSEFFLHGTTVGLNALLERRGARVGLLCTEGFRDVLAIRRGARQGYDILWTPPEPLVGRDLRLPVGERIRADGTVHRALNADDVRRGLDRFREAGVTSVAVCYLHAYANPEHELQTEAILREAGYDGPVSLSHRLSGEYRDYERTSTTVVDAFVRGRMARYLDHVQTNLAAIGFGGACLITRSGGGSMPFADAVERSFETIMSGPVGGAQGGAELSRIAALGDLVTADVGGTSFDTSLIVNGSPRLLYQGEVDGMPVQSPWMDVRSIGAGGGSIAFVDHGGLLQVGPHSAGAAPGPACYGRGGGEPTVTDALLYLGMLGEGQLASGLQLDYDLAAQALRPLAKKLQYDELQTARGIVTIAAVKTAGAIREITIEQGVDPRQLKLLAFGGAGPMLAVRMAGELDIGEVVVPRHAGNFSAWGLLGADIVQNTALTSIRDLDSGSLEVVNEQLATMFADLENRAGQKITGDLKREVGLDLRYLGQEYTLTIYPECEDGRLTLGLEALCDQFVTAYDRTYNVTLDAGIQVVTLRAALRQTLPRRKERVRSASRDSTHTRIRPAWSFANQAMVEFALLDRADLPVGSVTPGPAIIAEPTATTYVDSNYSIRIDEHGCMRLTRQEVNG